MIKVIEAATGERNSNNGAARFVQHLFPSAAISRWPPFALPKCNAYPLRPLPLSAINKKLSAGVREVMR